MRFGKTIAAACFASFATLAAGPDAVADFPHRTDFLSAGCFTHVAPGLDARERANCIKNIKSRGYTHFYVYAYNEKDYGGPRFDFYTNPTGYRDILKEIKGAGLKPVVWLNPDDAIVNRKRSISELTDRMTDLIPYIDDLVSSYVLGLELNEYWAKSKVNTLGKHLRTLTNKKIAVHQTKGRWDFCRFAWCDYMMLQYGFGKTAAQIKDMTHRAMKGLDKPVVAAEYSRAREGENVHLGNAAVSVGARGFGNGGTPGCAGGGRSKGARCGGEVAASDDNGLQ
jgi:hypothetical protein